MPYYNVLDFSCEGLDVIQEQSFTHSRSSSPLRSNTKLINHDHCRIFFSKIITHHRKLIPTCLDCRKGVHKTLNAFQKNVAITFDALQIADKHPSQQMRNLEKLSVGLAFFCGAALDDQINAPGHVTRVVSKDAMKMPSKIAFAMEHFGSITTKDRNSVTRAVSVIHLSSLTWILNIKAERNCVDPGYNSRPACFL